MSWFLLASVEVLLFYCEAVWTPYIIEQRVSEMWHPHWFAGLAGLSASRLNSTSAEHAGRRSLGVLSRLDSLVAVM